MEKKLDQILNCNESLRNHIKDFIEIFVEYYGEEQREYIEEKFNSALFIGYLTETQFDQTLSKLEQVNSDKLYKKILDETKLKVTKEQLFGKSFGDEAYSFKFENLQPINDYDAYFEEFMLGEEGREKSYYKQNYKSLSNRIPNITFEDYMKMAETGQVPLMLEGFPDNLKKRILDYADISFDQRRYQSKKEKAVKFLNSIGIEANIDNIEEITPSLTELNLLLDSYREAKETYQVEQVQKYSKYYDIMSSNKIIKDNLQEKYYKIFLQEIIEIIPERFRGEVQRYLVDDNERISYDLEYLVGSYLGNQGLYEYFSDEMTEKLNSENVSSWEKEQIKKNRIKYFKIIGIDLGDEYEGYLSQVDIWADKETINTFIEKKNKLLSDFDIEYYNSIAPQKQRIEEAKKRGLLSYDEKESLEMYSRHGILGCNYVSPNLVKDGDEYKLSPKVVINFGEDDAKDHFIIHELNHLYELSLVEVDGEYFKTTCGWDILNDKIEPDEHNNITDREKRDYELFNEIINEKISKEISKIMVDKGIAIFGEATEKSYKNVTSYDSTSYLVEDFFNQYKSEIIESRKNNNIQAIFDAVGKENFEKLNLLFGIHNKYFGGLEYYNLLNDLMHKDETKRTEIFKQIKEQRDTILGKMQEHYKNYKGLETPDKEESR